MDMFDKTLEIPFQREVAGPKPGVRGILSWTSALIARDIQKDTKRHLVRLSKSHYY